MNRQHIKTMILCLLSVILCVTTCAPAFASTGDRTLLRFSAEEQVNNNYIDSVYLMGDSFCVFYREGGSLDSAVILRYADAKAEPEKFILQRSGRAGEEEDAAAEAGISAEEFEAAAGEGISAGETGEAAVAGGDNPAGAGAPAEEAAAGEGIPEEKADEAAASAVAGEDFTAGEGVPGDGEFLSGEELFAEDYMDDMSFPSVYESVSELFSWKNELYAIVNRSEYNMMEGESKDTYVIKHVKLENGKAVTEDCDLPEPDFSSLMHEDGDYTYFGGISSPFVVGDTLMGTSWSNDENMLVAIDLNTGYCTEYAIGDFVKAVPGPEGSVLIQRYEQNEDDFKTKATVIRFSLEDQSEETVLELEGNSIYRLNICYEENKDTLYYTYNGELWAVPQLDREQAVSVNECPEAGDGAICMPDGFLLIWTNSAVLLRNTDPAQRSSTTLRVDISGWNTAATDAVYAMSEQRGDVAVLLQSMDAEDFDMLQAMLNRDSYMDVYTVYASGRDFNAFLNRGFLQDLSGNEQIAADTERMYPYIRNAVTRDGKIVGVPLYAYGAMMGVNNRLWKKMGGTEEELPKTWDQFFDWLGTLPEKLTEDIKLVDDDGWMNQDNFRADIRSMIMNQYQIRMEEQGEENFAFNTPLVSGLLKRLYEVDLDALGVREADESQEDDGLYTMQENDPLLLTYFDGTPGSYYSNIYMPLPLSLEEGEEPTVNGYVEVAILNPYSEHPEEAKQYLSLLLKNLSVEDQYTFFTDKTEPILNGYYTDTFAFYDEMMESTRKSLETAEGEDKVVFEEQLKRLEEEREDMDRWAWRVSQSSIDSYLAVNSMIRVPSHNFMEDINGSMGREEEKEFYEQLNREKDVEKLLNTIDSKLLMVRLEGN